MAAEELHPAGVAVGINGYVVADSDEPVDLQPLLWPDEARPVLNVAQELEISEEPHDNTHCPFPDAGFTRDLKKRLRAIGMSSAIRNRQEIR